jgi:hypothetical protein
MICVRTGHGIAKAVLFRETERELGRCFSVIYEF